MTVRHESAERIVTLTLDRPEKLNAVSFEMIDTLLGHLDEIEADPEVRAVILTGAGERAFSAGADIGEFAASVRAGPEAAVREFCRRGQRLTSRIEAFPKPVIAAVNGIAFGAGCEITEATHLAIASDTARFAQSEIQLGMPPTYGGTQRLPRQVGRKRALAMLLTGDPIDAARAEAIGLVNEVVPAAELIPRARALAARVNERAPLGVAACLTAVTRGLNVAIEEGLAVEAREFARVAASEDLQEGLAAFLEKREPHYKGR